MAKIETADSISTIVPVYFDSALIAKFYLNEPGREAIRNLAKNAGIVVTSSIAVAEISAAFHRKFREGAVDRDVFDALHGQFQHDLTNGLWRLIGPTEALLEQVRTFFVRLDRSVFLRSLDALHLITAKAEPSIASTPTIGIFSVRPPASVSKESTRYRNRARSHSPGTPRSPLARGSRAENKPVQKSKPRTTSARGAGTTGSQEKGRTKY